MNRQFQGSFSNQLPTTTIRALPQLHGRVFRGRRVSLLFPGSQCLYANSKIALVTIEIVRSVITRWFTYVIKIIRLSGKERRLKRAFSRRSDRPGRQACVQTGVVRRATFDVALINPSVISPLSFKLRSIDNS